ncbi:DUF4845 domain-containing protein [Pseudoduganella danionis]|uniref:DUF4845 domain-containing protein n=1 Tax=Pseudoduganella danionis TaxID=1890295 RepID=A0ABW9SP04_9BURK|nr:DUF4845 domain-containing protein [Pseudoduganella danionis]MTW33772.1 DUF4845 domain-containing protein [Pseudoduganella danionis]
MHTGKQRQQGISLVGLIVLLAVGGFVAVLALKIVPTYTEYRAIQNAIVSAKAGGGTVLQMQKSFDASATVGYISAINGKDLIISRGENGETEISFAYEKKIPLIGPASLLLEYEGSTAKHGMSKADQ